MSAIEEQQQQHNPAFNFLARQPPRRYLFGQGPSMVHPRVYGALSKPIVGHLDPTNIWGRRDNQLRPA
jgi:hypothetical protein